MNAACTPNGTATPFVPRGGIILRSSVLPPPLAGRGRRRLSPRRTRKRQTKKNPPTGATARRGVVGPRRKEGHHPPGRLAACFHQRGWLSVRFATLEPGNYRLRLARPGVARRTT